jgi:hypothetical protein
VGLQAKKVNRGQEEKPLFIIENSISSTSIQEGQPLNDVPFDEPIIGQGKDGIAWNIPEYQELWSNLPEKLRAEFKLNIEWMKEFMHKCVNERKKGGPTFSGCHLTTPPNLVLPPRKNESNGNYDFGVTIYNNTFNKQAKTLQDTYLTFYKEDPVTKVKTYDMMADALNALVEKEVDFGRGFF